MKTQIGFVIGLLAATWVALGQDGKIETKGTNAMNVVSASVAQRVTLRKEAPDEIRLERTTFKGPLVVLVKKQNPLSVFNPFKSGDSMANEKRPLYDPHLGGPQGIVLFSIHR